MNRLAEILAERDRREKAAPGLGEPAWIMLLDLIQCQSRGRKCSVTGLAAGSFVPHSTALRHIGELVAMGLAARVADPNDKRRDWVVVTDRGHALAAFVFGETDLRIAA